MYSVLFHLTCIFLLGLHADASGISQSFVHKTQFSVPRGGIKMISGNYDIHQDVLHVRIDCNGICQNWERNGKCETEFMAVAIAANQHESSDVFVPSFVIGERTSCATSPRQSFSVYSWLQCTYRDYLEDDCILETKSKLESLGNDSFSTQVSNLNHKCSI